MSRHRAVDPDDETTLIPRFIEPAPAPHDHNAAAPAPVFHPFGPPEPAATPKPVPPAPAAAPKPVPPEPAAAPRPVPPAPAAAPKPVPPVPAERSGPPRPFRLSGDSAITRPAAVAGGAARPLDSDATGIIPVISSGSKPAGSNHTADATGIIPVVPDQTMQLPLVRPSIVTSSRQPIPDVVSGRAVATDETGLIGRILPPPPKDDESLPEPKPHDRWSGEPPPPPVKAIKAGDQWRSIHSEYTRTTVGSILRSTMRGTGELMITFGLVLLLFAAYEMWGNTAIVDAHQDQLTQQLDDVWANPDPTVSASPVPGATASPAPGPNLANAVARLYIPRLNKQWVVVEGVTQADIRYAPGHYPKSAMPGQPGNFSVAGHRNRATFWDLDLMDNGMPIIVETKTSWYIYKVVLKRVVLPTQVEVVAPKPPVVKSREGKLLTLTTCNPKLDNYQRLIIHADFDREMPRSGPKPAELSR